MRVQLTAWGVEIRLVDFLIHDSDLRDEYQMGGSMRHLRNEEIKREAIAELQRKLEYLLHGTNVRIALRKIEEQSKINITEEDEDDDNE